MDVQIVKLLMDGNEKQEIFEILKPKTNDPHRLAKEIAKYPRSFYMQKYNIQLVRFSNMIYFSYFFISPILGIIPFLIGLFCFLNRRIGNINRLKIIFFINFPAAVIIVGWIILYLKWENLTDFLLENEIPNYLFCFYFLLEVFIGFYSLYLLIKIYQFRLFFRLKWDRKTQTPVFRD